MSNLLLYILKELLYFLMDLQLLMYFQFKNTNHFRYIKYKYCIIKKLSKVKIMYNAYF